MRGARAAVQGMEAGILGPFGAPPGPATGRCHPRLSPGPAKPMLGANQKTVSSWGDHLCAAFRCSRAYASFAFAILPMAAAPAQTVALSGQVTSAEEGAMEGVLVSAKKAGSTITVTVVSDEDGRYSFPASKLEPGQYALRIRAVGYDLDNHKSIEVAAQKTTTADLKLRKTEDLAAQTVERRMDQQHPGQRSAQGRVAQLRRLPHARARHALDPRRRRLPEDHAAAHAGLREPEHPAAPAASQRRAADGGARRPARAGLQGDGGLPRRPSISARSRSGASRSTRCRGRAAAPRA